MLLEVWENIKKINPDLNQENLVILTRYVWDHTYFFQENKIKISACIRQDVSSNKLKVG